MAAWGKCHNYIMTAYITIVFTVIIIYIHYQFSIASLFYCQCHCVLVLLLLVLLLLVLFIIAVLVHHYCHISWLHYYNMLQYCFFLYISYCILYFLHLAISHYLQVVKDDSCHRWYEVDIAWDFAILGRAAGWEWPSHRANSAGRGTLGAPSGGVGG